MQLDERLFRHESGRMVAALTRLLGVHNLALAEDVVQEAFCRAAEVWKFRGVPDNPAAWLMATAKNRALDAVRSAGIFRASGRSRRWSRSSSPPTRSRTTFCA
jgi:RNA polymerase sigma-70 factor (ECF subfamily)